MYSYSARLRRKFTIAATISLVVFAISTTPLAAAEPSLGGYVYGQDDKGLHLGPVAGAKLEFIGGGKTLSATADDNGYFRVPTLAVGEYRYKITGAGYRDEDSGRGLQITGGAMTHNFVLTKGVGKPAAPAAPASLSGHVWKATAAGKEPIAGSVVALRPEANGSTLLVRTDADGAYSLSLAAGKWRASASAVGFAPQVESSLLEVAAGDKSTLDFTFSSTTTATTVKAGDVQVMVAVQPSADASRGRLPTVRFVSVDANGGAKTVAATAKPLNPDELASLGLTVDTAADDVWEWFTAAPDEPLPAGTYRAEATLTEYHDGASDAKAVAADSATFFDVTLRPKKPKPPKTGSPQPPTAAPATETFVHGRVIGQDDKGNHLGIVAGAKLQLTAADGKPAADVTTDENGYYKVADMKPGAYRYTLTADGYRDERAGRGFQVPAIGAYVYDFVLTKGTTTPHEPPKPAELAGHVWEEKAGGKQPIGGAIVALRPEAGGQTLLTRSAADGAYSFSPPPGQWRASAVAQGFPPFIESKPLSIAAGDKSTLDFTFKLTTATAAPQSGQVFVYVAVQPSQTAPRGRVPQVQLRGNADQTPRPAKVRPLDDKELADLGLANSSQGSWDWFVAEPEQPLPAGDYRAAAELAEYRSHTGDAKTVAAVGATFFDLTLRADKPAETEPPATTPGTNAAPQTTTVHGRVTGQDDKGNHLGVVADAHLLVKDAAGRRVRAVKTDSNGYYRLLNMRPGEFHYALSAEGYRDENANRGFNVPGPGTYVYDFVLTWGTTPPVTPPPVATNPPITLTLPSPCVLTGHVWEEIDGQKVPLAGAVVALCPTQTRQATLARTDDDGGYEVTLAPGTWRASAVTDGYEPQLEQNPLVCAEGEKKTLDFTFTAASKPEPHQVEVIALVGLESAQAAVGLHADAPPAVMFVCGDDSQAPPCPAIVEPIAGGANKNLLADYGLATSSAVEDFDWYVARPSTPLPVGRYRVEGRKEGYINGESSRKAVVANVRNFYEVRMSRIRPEVTVIVQGADKSPVKDVEVKLVNKDLGRRFDQAATFKTDAGGRDTKTLADGTGNYNAMLSGTGLQPQGRAVRIEGVSTTLTFQVFKEGEQRTADFAGMVLKRKKAADPSATAAVADSEAEPLPNAKLTLRPQGGETVPTALAAPLVTDSSGNFQARDVPEGEYLVLVEAVGCSGMTTQLTVVADMQPAKYYLDPRNLELDDALRRMLTDGWGRAPENKTAADRAYDDALKADPKGCRPDYVRALVLMKAGDFTGAYDRLHAAVTKKQVDFVWDRVCEARIYLDMFRRQPKQASLEMEALAKLHYADRPVNHAGEETSHLMGISCGVLKGPWKKESTGIDLDAMERAILAALKPQHRAEFERGRDEVAGKFTEMQAAKADAEKTEREAAEAKKMEDQAAADARKKDIDGEMKSLNDQAQTAQAAAQAKAQDIERRNLPLVAARQQLAVQAQPLIAERNQISQCLAIDRGRAVSSSNPSDPNALSSPDPAVLEEIRQHEFRLLEIGRLLALLNVQDQQYQQQQAVLQMEYNRASAELNGTMQQLNSRNQALTREQSTLNRQEKMRENAKPAGEAAADFAHRSADFTTFSIYPLEQRRQEVLELLSR